MAHDLSKNTDMADYGILCSIQDLSIIVKNLDKFIKKYKIRGQGIHKELGWKTCIEDSPDEKFYEWMLWEGRLKAPLPPELGYTWHFDVYPNRYYRIKPDGTAVEAYTFPDRKDIPIYCTLIKHNFNGDDEETNKVREDFFKCLLDSIGFPVEKLYQYSEGEERLS